VGDRRARGRTVCRHIDSGQVYDKESDVRSARPTRWLRCQLRQMVADRQIGRVRRVIGPASNFGHVACPRRRRRRQLDTTTGCCCSSCRMSDDVHHFFIVTKRKTVDIVRGKHCNPTQTHATICYSYRYKRLHGTRQCDIRSAKVLFMAECVAFTHNINREQVH